MIFDLTAAGITAVVFIHAVLVGPVIARRRLRRLTRLDDPGRAAERWQWQTVAYKTAWCALTGRGGGATGCHLRGRPQRRLGRCGLGHLRVRKTLLEEIGLVARSAGVTLAAEAEAEAEAEPPAVPSGLERLGLTDRGGGPASRRGRSL